MKSWFWLAMLPVVWVLIYEKGVRVHSKKTLGWAEVHCEQITDSAPSGAACQAAVSEAHDSCLRDSYTPPSRYNRISEIDREGYWDCVAEQSPAVPPHKKPPRLRL